MQKRFCDACGKEIQRNYAQAYNPSLTSDGFVYKAHVTIEVDILDVCLECVLKIVNEGKE